MGAHHTVCLPVAQGSGLVAQKQQQLGEDGGGRWEWGEW